MMDQAYVIMLISALVIVVYFYVKARLVEFLEPFRMELLRRAEWLSHRADLTDHDRLLIEFAIDHAYSRRVGWALALGLFPFSLRTLRKPRRSEAMARPYNKDMNAFVRLFAACVVCASPLSMLVFCMSFLASLIVRGSVQRAMELVLSKQSAHADHEHRLAH
ncbi:hypothetical protein [Rhizobium sp. CSW-27]|uniref:hypothetical protein n=1 Tax=Rhizobium sp. CSW-27 TaxID=2839985 RepID=UPI001C037DEB|nr:hypothetical protein [Rhizobium sp. CSW-27]MBT9370256.1 hypothetical protein [Rhizobium sp. CSW-27]